MGLKAARFIHQQTPYGKFNGFSVYFWPHDTDASLVNYSVALCSNKDHFCKATARETCFNHKEQTCRIIDFPIELAKLDYIDDRHIWDVLSSGAQRAIASRWAWVYKYFL